nr:MAG TPA: integrase [Caudoviricetes sp.]
MQIRNAVAYCRFSSDNQRSESIDAQIRAIKEYCKNNKYMLTHIYKDEALSGTSDKRDQFQQMITDSKDGLFDAVIVHKLDRFARNRYDSAIYKKKLKDNGVVVLSVLENLDDTPEAVILESVLEGMNEYYSKNLSREVRKGLNENAIKCIHNGGIPPLGYDVTPDKHYCINEKEAAAVRLIFNMYSENYGYRLIINKLNELGYKTKLGRSFSVSSLHDIIINEKYRGVYVWNKRKSKKAGNHAYKDDEEIVKIEGGMPRIISDDLFFKCQKIKKTKIKPRRHSSHEYILTGKIFCGKCDHSYCGSSAYRNKNNNMVYNYCCMNRKNKKGCDNKAINADKLEYAVLEAIRDTFLNDDAIKLIANKMDHYLKETVSTVDKDAVSKLNRDLENIDTKQERLIDLYLDEKLSIESLNKKSALLDQEKTIIKNKLNELSNIVKLDFNIDEIIVFLNDMKGKLNDTDSQTKRTLIEAFIYRISINEDDVDIMLYLDNLIDKNCDNIGGGEENRIVSQFMYEYKIKRQYINFPLTNS